MSESPDASVYNVSCHNCLAAFDALQVPFCSCIVTQRTLICPCCLNCFCKAQPAYKQKFWAGAPRELWNRNFEEHHVAFAPVPNPEPSAVNRPLVLVVDDETDIQRIATHAVESLGYGVILARNGQEGLELTRRYLPDLVLADALMPKLDGREMCRKVKTDPATSRVKVVVMTALYTSIKYRTEGLRHFLADDYLSKPLEFTQLRALLQKHLG
jgi:CheY-like chemotaxis protein